MKQPSSALILAAPGPLRDALRAVLAAVCRLDAVCEADSIAQAAVKADPALVLLSVDGPRASCLTGIIEVKARWPSVHCVVLVDTVAQQRAAQAAGAEQALIKGIRPVDLLGRIEGVLAQEREASARLPGS